VNTPEQMKPVDISVVIPVLNERDNLKPLFKSLSEVTSSLGLNAQVIIADGGSEDGSRELAAEFGAQVVDQIEPGYGGALLAGFAAASAPYVVTMDADLSHQPVFLDDFWKERENADVLIASRYIEGGRADMGQIRRVLSLILNKTYGRVLSMPLRDLSSGFRMYRSSSLARLDLQARDFDVLEEILVKIYVGGGRIKEVPFHYRARNSGKSHAKLVRFGWAFSKTLLRMWRLRRQGERF
jgi:glycosyltransferase involved in cell wall biosynthesis